LRAWKFWQSAARGSYPCIHLKHRKQTNGVSRVTLRSFAALALVNYAFKKCAAGKSRQQQKGMKS
jgi:hypothetical protein